MNFLLYSFVEKQKRGKENGTPMHKQLYIGVRFILY